MGKGEEGRLLGGDSYVHDLDYGDEFKGIKIHYIVHFKYMEFIIPILSIKAVLKREKLFCTPG